MRKNNPNLSRDYSVKLAKVILEKSEKYDIPARLLAAVLMQESSYKITAKNIKCGISVVSGVKDCIIVDYGIGQINHSTIKRFKLDQRKLLSNLEYSVEASAMVLADFKRMYGHRENEYWTRYNASTPAKRNIYKNLVSRYL